MKSSGKGGRRSARSRECVIVDGYNVIARMLNSALDEMEDIAAARQQLLELLKEFRAYSGQDVVLVFDAHHAKQPGGEAEYAGVRVIYTTSLETADDRIERLVYEFRDVYRRITVATSDLAEQQVTFGHGALRISAAEFLRQLRDMKRSIRHTVSRDYEPPRGSLGDTLRHDIANILEKWRRG